MKTFIKPLAATVLILASSSIFAADSYSVTKLKEIICSMDDNADKKISFKEFFEASITDNNDSYDVNKDGYITAGEVALEMKEDLIDTIKELQKHGVSEKNTNATIEKELNAIDKESEAIIKAMDTDGDNLVEPNELKAYKQQQFKKLDKNQDGVISKSDLTSEKHGGYTYKPYQR